MLLSFGSFGDGRTLEYVKFVLPSSCPLSGIFNGGWFFCRDPSFEVLKRMATDNCGALINCARCRDEATLEWMNRYSIFNWHQLLEGFCSSTVPFWNLLSYWRKRGGGRIFMKVFTTALWWPGVGSRTTTVLARAQGPASECEGSPVTWNCRESVGGGLQFLDYENQSFLELGGEFSIPLGLGFQFLGCICGLLGSMVSI